MSQTTAQLISNLVQALAFESTSSAPDNGVYLSAANTLSLSTNGIDRITAGTSELVINESGASVDFRVEGDTNANLLFIDASTDRIGVGTSSPGAKLEVKGGDLLVNNVGSGRIFIQDTDATDDVFALKVNGGIFSVQDSNDSLGFVADIFKIYEGAPESSLVISSSGNVGVGTTSPASILHCASSGDNNIRVVANSQTAQLGVDTGTPFVGTPSGAFNFYANGSPAATLDSSGRLGIGTTSPSVPLEVRASQADLRLIADAGGFCQLQFGDTNDTVRGGVVFDCTNNLLQLRSHNNETAVTIDSSERVGIGTTSPTFPLQVETTATGTTAGSNGVMLVQSQASGRDAHIRFGDSVNATARVGYLSNSLYAYVNSQERARIDSSGRLLVGTSSARSGAGINCNLQVEGTGATDSSLSLIRNSANAAPPYLVLGKSRGTALNSNTVVQNNDILGSIEFAAADGNDIASTGALIKCEIDGTPGSNDTPGRLVFSTTADGASSPTERMRINDGGTTGIRTTTARDVLYLCSPDSASASLLYISARHTSSSMYGGTESFRVFTNGNVQNTNNSYGSISDIKLKENIVDASSQWDDLKAIQVRNYNFKEETGQPTHTQIGVVAQEIELVSPGLVTESPDRDDEDNDLGTTTKSVNYSVLYMKAVKALQEAMERIETLEAKVAALEAN